jgi:hypothetical protein
MLLVLAVLAVSYATSIRAWLQQRSDINTYSAQIAASRSDIKSLTQLKQRLHDPVYLHTQARERFGWLLPGQTGYRVIDASGHVWKAGSGQLTLQTPAGSVVHREWWDRAWRSIVLAGTGGTPPGERAYRHRHAEHVVPYIGKVPNFPPAPGHSPHAKLPDSGRGIPGP